MKTCKYRLPCGRCDKFNTFCDLTFQDIVSIEKEISTKECEKECEHDWVFQTESTNDYNENGELYYITTKHCVKCGCSEMLRHISSV